ncbi:MAG: hypothetical protein SFU91_15360 [Chloroherpetonaceae bacterium]|nr:hypothetical protein [Chloroherpetonaceae bacterium]
MSLIYQSMRQAYQKVIVQHKIIYFIFAIGFCSLLNSEIAKAQNENSEVEKKNTDSSELKTRDIVYLADSRKLVGKVIAKGENGKISFQNFEDNVVYELERGSYKWFQTETIYPTQITSQLTFNYGLNDAYRAGAGIRVGIILPNSSFEITAGYGFYTGRNANGFTIQDGQNVPLKESLKLHAGDLSVNYLFRLNQDVTIRPFTGFGVNFVAYNRTITLPDFFNTTTIDFPIDEDYLELRLNFGLGLDLRISGPIHFTANVVYLHELGSDYALSAFPQILTYKNAAVTSVGLRFIF